MKHHIPDIIRKNSFDCFKSLNAAERAVVMYGEDEYRKSLDLDNDDAPCWKIPSKESTTFVGWNPMCIPTMDYIVWKLKRREQIAKRRNLLMDYKTAGVDIIKGRSFVEYLKVLAPNIGGFGGTFGSHFGFVVCPGCLAQGFPAYSHPVEPNQACHH